MFAIQNKLFFIFSYLKYRNFSSNLGGFHFKHITLGANEKKIKITPTTNFQTFMVYGYRFKVIGAILLVPNKTGDVSRFSYKNFGEETVSVTMDTSDMSAIITFSDAWGQADIISNCGFSTKVISE